MRIFFAILVKVGLKVLAVFCRAVALLLWGFDGDVFK